MKYERWEIPRAVAVHTENAFLTGRNEVFVIWSSPRSTDDTTEAAANITRCIVPKQTPGVTRNGVWVHIAGEELQRIQLDNFAKKERSVVQLHTHPGHDVTMSALDREWEVVRHVGALSIIVPFYGTSGLLLGSGANVYERGESDWRLWSAAEAKERLVMT